jgi:DNA-directed RNA polymerase subunit M/transcription elongation factor TFIIS
MEILLPITAVILVAVFVGYLRRERPKLSCPKCVSSRVRLVEKQLKELKQDRATGHAVKLDVQLIMETKYRCQACGHTWNIIAPET